MNLFFRSLFFVLLCFLTGTGLFAQDPTETAGDIRQLVDSLNYRAYEQRKNNSVEAYAMLLKAGELADSINYPKGLAENYFNRAGILQLSGLKQKALSYYNQSVYYSHAAGDDFLQAKANQQIAGSLSEGGRYKEAQKLLQSSLYTYRQKGNIQDVINVYNSLGDVFTCGGMYQESKMALDTALALSIANDYTYGEKKVYYYLGCLYLKQKNFSLARQNFNSAMLMNEKSRDSYGLAQCNLQLSKLFSINAQYDSALYYAQSAGMYAQLQKAGALQILALEQVILAYKNMGQTDKVIMAQEQMIALQDSIYEQEKTSALELSELIRRQEQQNEQNQQRIAIVRENSYQQRIWLFVVGALLMGTIAIALWSVRNYQRVNHARSELSSKNEIIASIATSLERLNKAIKLQNENLEEENRMKDKLLSIISHDLRHPLVNTKSILDLINLKLVSAEETERLLEQLDSQYIHSITLLDNLLFWIRSRMQGGSPENTPVNMHTLVGQLIDEQRVPLQHKEIVAVNMVNRALIWECDREMIKVIFRNLLSNAIKFTPQGGTVRCYTESNGSGGYTMFIRDSGIGMTPEVLAKVNARQYYSGRGTGNEKGSGFGLVLVRDLLRRQGAELKIDSEPGRGSTFSVEVPVEQMG